MKRLLPDSLAAWVIIILIGALSVTQISTLLLIAKEREQAEQMVDFFRLTERVLAVARAVTQVTGDLQPQLVKNLSTATMAVELDPEPAVAANSKPNPLLAEFKQALEQRLADSGVTEVALDRVQGPLTLASGHGDRARAAEQPGSIGERMADIASRFTQSDLYIVSLELDTGQWLNIFAPIAIPASPWKPTTLALAALSVFVALCLSLWALRRLTLPYSAIGSAAERIGRDINAPALRETGPREAREAARALNVMQQRIRSHVSEREQLALAISHDIRTPLTRLRLRVDDVEDEALRCRLVGDLDEIEQMTKTILSFARERAKSGEKERLDLVSLLEVVCDDMPNVELALDGRLPQRIPIVANGVELRRCIANLVDNAVKYGDHARVSLVREGGSVVVRVDDQGPGIPEHAAEEVFSPYARLDLHGDDRGGTGLGLTIARSIARDHGAEVRLSNRAEGGLRAELVLPLSGPPPPAPPHEREGGR